MNKIIKIYEHQNMNFDVEFTKDGFFNATKIAKQFGKQASKWLENKDTQEYISEISKVHGIEINDLLILKKGGYSSQQGTWLHPKLIVAFARWLSAHFAVWCDQQIDEILFSQKLKQLIDNDELQQFVGDKNIYYFIYIFYSDVLNAYKIGVSRNIERRFKQIQDNLKFLGFNPVGTEIIFSQICDSKKAFILEKQIHQYYEKYRLNESEWFSFDESQLNKVIDYIENLITQKTDV